jgi:hypothetical protein
MKIPTPKLINELRRPIRHDSWEDTYISIEEQPRLVSILLEAAAQLEWFLRKEMLKNENLNS